MAPNKDVSSRSSGFNMATSVMKRVKVTPVVSHTSSKTGALVFAEGADVSTVACKADDGIVLTECCAIKAFDARTTQSRATTKRFIVTRLSE